MASIEKWVGPLAERLKAWLKVRLQQKNIPGDQGIDRPALSFSLRLYLVISIVERITFVRRNLPPRIYSA